MIVEIVYRDRPHSVFEVQPPGHADACIATETRLSLETDGLWIEADRYEMGAAGDGAAPVAVRRRWWRCGGAGGASSPRAPRSSPPRRR